MLTGSPTGLVERALTFARTAHDAVSQRRKYTGEPYIVHPIAVAATVARVRHTDVMLAAALLHDTVEDTRVTLDDIEREFGAEVRDLVYWLTDISTLADGNRATRKALDRTHIGRAPTSAKTIKLADLLDNTVSIVAHDSVFAPIYLREKEALLEVLQDGDSLLWHQAKELVAISWATLDQHDKG